MYDWNDNRITTNLQQLNGMNVNKKIALTFDDGPNEYTEKILEILKKNQVEATFFWITSQIKDISIGTKVIEDGHTLGLHGFRHIPLHTLDKRTQERELKKGLKQLQRFINNEGITYFRPPYGRYNDATIEVLKEIGLKPILWDIASLDWELENDNDKIIFNIINHVQDGSIILLHDLPQTVAVLEELILELKNLGYQFHAI